MINATSSMAFSDATGGSSGSYHRTPTKNHHRTSSSMGQNNNNNNNNNRISRNSNSIDYYFGGSNSNNSNSSTTSGSTPSSSCSPIHQFEYDFFLKSLVVGCGGGGGGAGESNYPSVVRSNPGYLRTMSAINQATSFQQQHQFQQPLYHSPSLSLASPPVKRNSNTSASYHHHNHSHSQHSHRNHRNVRSQTAANTPTNPNQNFAEHLFSSITSLNSQQLQQPNKSITTKSGFSAKLSQSPPKSSILPKVPTPIPIPTPNNTTTTSTTAYQNLEISKPQQRSRKQNDYSKLPIVNRTNSNPNSSHTKSSLIQDPSVGNFSANLGINYYSQLSTASLYQQPQLPMDSSKHLNNNNSNNRIASIMVSEVVSLQDEQQQQDSRSIVKTQNSSHKQTKTNVETTSLDQFIDLNIKQYINDDEIGDDEERLSATSKSISMITEINHKSLSQQQQQSIKQPTRQKQSLPFSSTTSINKETDCGVSDCYGSNGAANANANVNNNSLVVASIGGFETMDSFNGKIEHQHLHALHRFRQQRKKGLLCRLRDVVISFSPRARYSILNRDHLFFRFGPDEWDALASFDFLQSFGTDLDDNDNVENEKYRYQQQQQQVETNNKKKRQPQQSNNTVMRMIDDEIDFIEIDMEIEELLNYYCDISDDTDFDDEEEVDEVDEEEMKQHSSLSLTNSTASSSSSSCCLANHNNNNLEDNTGTKKNGGEEVESSSKCGRLKPPHQTKLLQLKQFTTKSRQNGRKAK